MNDFTNGATECFCDRKHKDANKFASCGDCPRDYIAGAWDARRAYLEEHSKMIDRYEEWRTFYTEKVRSWMSLEELRAECGKLTTTDATSPELLLIHAMHALEECEQHNEALLRQALEALEYYRSGEDYQPTPASEAIRAIRDRLNETCEHEPVLVETLLGDWQFCKHCNRSWTTEMEKAYVARTKPHYEPEPNEGSEP